MIKGSPTFSNQFLIRSSMKTMNKKKIIEKINKYLVSFIKKNKKLKILKILGYF